MGNYTPFVAIGSTPMQIPTQVCILIPLYVFHLSVIMHLYINNMCIYQQKLHIFVNITTYQQLITHT